MLTELELNNELKELWLCNNGHPVSHTYSILSHSKVQGSYMSDLYHRVNGQHPVSQNFQSFEEA